MMKNKNYDKAKIANFESKIVSKKGIVKSLTLLKDFGSICMTKISCPFDNSVPNKNSNY